MAAGVKRTPSVSSTTGIVRKKEAMVMSEKRLMLSMEPYARHVTREHTAAHAHSAVAHLLDALGAAHELLGEHVARLEGEVAAHGRRKAAPVERGLLRRMWRHAPAASAQPAGRTEKEASATPATMGSSEATIASVGVDPRKAQESTTEKKGSMALMVCVKDTETALRLTLVNRLPSVCTAASGRTPKSTSLSTCEDQRRSSVG